MVCRAASHPIRQGFESPYLHLFVKIYNTFVIKVVQTWHKNTLKFHSFMKKRAKLHVKIFNSFIFNNLEFIFLLYCWYSSHLKNTNSFAYKFVCFSIHINLDMYRKSMFPMHILWKSYACLGLIVLIGSTAVSVATGFVNKSTNGLLI